MKTACNKYWTTRDDAEMLMLECVKQHLQGNPDDLFGLPNTIYLHHALILSIGHLHHDRQMRTGFTKRFPNSLADYDESLNNIYFETVISNKAKWDFSEAD
jgi:hypothetical protein